MSQSVKQIIEIRAPQYLTHPRLDGLITYADGMTGSEFNVNYNKAVALRVMHMLAKEDIRNGNADNSGIAYSGRVLSKKEGALAISFGQGGGNINNKHGDLNTTSFGQELISLMDGCLLNPRNRFFPSC